MCRSDSCVSFPRHREGAVAARPGCGDLRRGSPHQELPRQHVAGAEEHPVAAARGADRLPAAEQPAGVLVHGGLRAARLPGDAAGVQQHVRAADPERTVYRQHAA